MLSRKVRPQRQRTEREEETAGFFETQNRLDSPLSLFFLLSSPRPPLPAPALRRTAPLHPPPPLSRRIPLRRKTGGERARNRRSFFFSSLRSWCSCSARVPRPPLSPCFPSASPLPLCAPAPRAAPPAARASRAEPRGAIAQWPAACRAEDGRLEETHCATHCPIFPDRSPSLSLFPLLFSFFL